MEQMELSVKKTMETLGMGRTTVYDWIKSGKLECKDTPRGKIIVITDEQIEEIRKYTGFYDKSSGNSGISSEFNGEHSEHFESIQGNFVRTDELSVEMLRTMNEMRSELLGYAEKAGQVKLLEDSENRTKAEYFELIQKNAELSAELKLVRQENSELKQELENLKKPFWKRK